VGRTEIDCPDDEAALEHAKNLADGHAVELWEGSRRIALIDGIVKGGLSRRLGSRPRVSSSPMSVSHRRRIRDRGFTVLSPFATQFAA
jgi:hypothetical protein